MRLIIFFLFFSTIALPSCVSFEGNPGKWSVRTSGTKINIKNFPIDEGLNVSKLGASYGKLFDGFNLEAGGVISSNTATWGPLDASGAGLFVGAVYRLNWLNIGFHQLHVPMTFLVNDSYNPSDRVLSEKQIARQEFVNQNKGRSVRYTLELSAVTLSVPIILGESAGMFFQISPYIGSLEQRSSGLSFLEEKYLDLQGKSMGGELAFHSNIGLGTVGWLTSIALFVALFSAGA